MPIHSGRQTYTDVVKRLTAKLATHGQNGYHIETVLTGET
jgi:hypothetical protein